LTVEGKLYLGISYNTEVSPAGIEGVRKAQADIHKALGGSGDSHVKIKNVKIKNVCVM